MTLQDQLQRELHVSRKRNEDAAKKNEGEATIGFLRYGDCSLHTQEQRAAFQDLRDARQEHRLLVNALDWITAQNGEYY